MVQGVVSEHKWPWHITMDTLPVTHGWFVRAILLVAVLAGCSDDVDDRKQAVYRTEPGTAAQPRAPGYGQQYQQPTPQYAAPQYPAPQYAAPQYPARSPYQQPHVPNQRPAPRFEISDPGNPWAYKPMPRYTPPEAQTAPAQPWAESGSYRGTEQPGGSAGYGFGGYRPLDSGKAKRETAKQAGVPQGVPAYPYYPAPYPYGGATPYGPHNQMGWPGAGWPPVR